jgi:hypothetical protein
MQFGRSVAEHSVRNPRDSRSAACFPRPDDGRNDLRCCRASSAVGRVHWISDDVLSARYRSRSVPVDSFCAFSSPHRVVVVRDSSVMRGCCVDRTGDPLLGRSIRLAAAGRRLSPSGEERIRRVPRPVNATLAAAIVVRTRLAAERRAAVTATGTTFCAA